MIRATSQPVKAKVTKGRARHRKNHYVQLNIDHARYLLTPTEAYELANKLTDHAEQLEQDVHPLP